VAEVHHSDKQGGEAQGKRYGEASYVTTLSFSVKDGMPSPPCRRHQALMRSRASTPPTNPNAFCRGQPFDNAP
jgi:hypothetical protein